MKNDDDIIWGLALMFAMFIFIGVVIFCVVNHPGFIWLQIK